MRLQALCAARGLALGRAAGHKLRQARLFDSVLLVLGLPVLRVATRFLQNLRVVHTVGDARVPTCPGSRAYVARLWRTSCKDPGVFFRHSLRQVQKLVWPRGSLCGWPSLLMPGPSTKWGLVESA